MQQIPVDITINRTAYRAPRSAFSNDRLKFLRSSLHPNGFSRRMCVGKFNGLLKAGCNSRYSGPSKYTQTLSSLHLPEDCLQVRHDGFNWPRKEHRRIHRCPWRMRTQAPLDQSAKPAENELSTGDTKTARWYTAGAKSIDQPGNVLQHS